MERYANKKDLLLMSYFRQNARENLTKISRMTAIPVSTIFDKLKEFERTLIQKHTTIIDFRKLGFQIKMIILFKISKEGRNAFKEFLFTNENINSIFRVNNGYDYLVEGIFRDMDDFQRFSESLERFPVEEKQEHFILEDLKREGFLSERVHIELLYNEVNDDIKKTTA